MTLTMILLYGLFVGILCYILGRHSERQITKDEYRQEILRQLEEIFNSEDMEY